MDKFSAVTKPRLEFEHETGGVNAPHASAHSPTTPMPCCCGDGDAAACCPGIMAIRLAPAKDRLDTG